MFPNRPSSLTPLRIVFGIVSLSAALGGATASAQPAAGAFEYRVLATNKTSTMEKELNEAAEAGFRYAAVMGGETSFGGSEVVTITGRAGGQRARYEYRLLATNKTSTMQKEIQAASDAGFEYVGQTVFKSAFGGKEVVCILERDKTVAKPARYEYRLLATKKTATMQKELSDVGEAGYDVVGMTVSETAMGGAELVTITRRRLGQK